MQKYSIGELTRLLQSQDFGSIYAQAAKVTKERFGGMVNLRGIIEISNICMRKCAYCGLNCNNGSLLRYRMSPQEIIAAAEEGAECGYRTVVLQSGESDCYSDAELESIINRITETGVTVTLSLGERGEESFNRLFEAGARRYLLKHETCDPVIYGAMHPDGSLSARLRSLKTLKSIGYETGSGFMVGLPNDCLRTVADNILTLGKLKCDMAGISPFIPHPGTPLAHAAEGNSETVLRAVALTRLCYPGINLPATTALITSGQTVKTALESGANVIMRKLTPRKWAAHYEIYPVSSAVRGIKEDRAYIEKLIKDAGGIPL